MIPAEFTSILERLDCGTETLFDYVKNLRKRFRNEAGPSKFRDALRTTRGTSLHDQVHHWTYGRDISGEFSWARFERKIRTFFDTFLNEFTTGRRIVFYQAGADVHVDDPLGPLEPGMFDHDMHLRDRLICDQCHQHGVPLDLNLAGGYQRDERGEISKVLELYRATKEECARCFAKSSTTGMREGKA